MNYMTSHVKLYLDINISDVKPNIECDRSHIPELVSKVSEVDQRLAAGGWRTTGQGFEIPLHVLPLLVVAMRPCLSFASTISRRGLS